ncbi:hypothetical protein ACG7TL_001145 [Trametes sanguinea]
MPESGDRKLRGERTPSVTWRQLWLDIVPDTQTMDDPAPFCWPDFESAVVDTIPIYSPRATPSNCKATSTDIAAAQAYASAYWASDDRIKFDRAAANNQHAAGRKVVIDYLHKTRRAWGIQSKIDEALEQVGITLYVIAQPDLGGIPPVERGFPAIPDLIDRWFGSSADDYEAKEASWNFFRQLLGITWQRWRKTLKRDSKTLGNLEVDVERAEAACAAGEGTAEQVFKALSALLTKLAPYRLHRTRGKQHQDVVDKLREMENTLQKDDQAHECTKISKALRMALQNMPSAHDAEVMLARIVEVINAAEAEGDLELEPTLSIQWAEGVEAYKKLTIQEMQAAFGLPSEHFPFFNKKTDNTSNEDPWSDTGREALKSANAADLKPFWHQWVGLLKISDNMMAGKNVLLMDQVGVGKTMQAVGMIAMYEWLRVNKETRGQYPTRFEHSTKGAERLPRRSHVVVCTPNLVQQWTTEMHRYLEFGLFTILPYLGSCVEETRRGFWQAVDSIPAETTVIILTTFSAIKSDAQLFFYFPEKPPTAYDTPTRQRHALDPAVGKVTIYSREFGVVIFDEAHMARKPGPTQISVAELARRAFFAMGMTATPIVTSPMDIVLLARVLRISGFDSEVNDMHRRALNRARSEERKDGDTIAITVAIAGGQAPDGDEDRPVRKALFAWVDYIRSKIADYVIRRTTSSLDREGQPIHKLHAIYKVPFLVTLRDDEMEVQQVLAEKLQVEGAKATKKNLESAMRAWRARMSSVGVRVARTRTFRVQCALGGHACPRTTKDKSSVILEANPKKPLQSFYLGIRQALLHKFAPDIEGYQFPRDHDSLRYSDYPSTKIDALLELISYHKGKSCQPPATINDGQVIHSGESIDDWSNWPAVPDAPIDKIIVYLAFPSQNWIIRKALLENGFAFEEIHGRATPSQRVASLKAFQTGSKQVLLMSNVGTVGLNIAFANIVVVMDNLWSAQETEQLMGRVWRHPQEKKVIEYHIVAEGTSDIFIGGISFDKGLAHRRLMHMPTTLQRALVGGSDNIHHNDDGDANSDDDMNNVNQSSGKPSGYETTTVPVGVEINPNS